jgi:acylphosphatase
MSDMNDNTIFQTGNGVPANFNDGTIKVVVNGSDKGRKPTTAGETLGQFLNRMASYFGVRTFSAYADGRKLETNAVNGPVTAVREVEITAKDSRGVSRMSKPERKKYIFCTTEVSA